MAPELKAAACGLGLLLLVSCTPPPPAKASPKAPLAGARLLAISAMPRSDPPPGAKELVGAVDLVYSSGARGDFEGRTWKSLEARPGRPDVGDLRGSLDYMGNQRGLALLFNLKVIDTSAKLVPDDLAGVAWDNGNLKSRFHALVDAVKPVTTSHLRYLSIGNEVDVYLSAHPGEWDAYRSFFQDAVGYVHTALPGVKVGVTTTFDGARGPNAQRVAALNAAADVVILTYYPLDGSYRPRTAATASGDFATMAGLAGSKPLVLQEVGYPSAGQLGSSEQAEAAFFTNVFAAWNQQGARIAFLNVFALHDLAPSTCDALAGFYGRPGDANLKAYLCSLGLRHANGTPKPAWQATLDGAKGSGLPQ